MTEPQPLPRGDESKPYAWTGPELQAWLIALEALPPELQPHWIHPRDR